MNTLRSRVIHLAHENPNLRPHLLPLLKEAGCEKLPEGGMRDNCEKKKEEGKESDKGSDKKAAENDPVLIQMEKDLKAAQKSVTKAVAMLKKAPAAKSDPGSVVPTAIKDLTKLSTALKELVGNDAPYIWGMIDPAKGEEE